MVEHLKDIFYVLETRKNIKVVSAQGKRGRDVNVKSGDSDIRGKVWLCDWVGIVRYYMRN
jgi:hypothetical protein